MGIRLGFERKNYRSATGDTGEVRFAQKDLRDAE
jgi:hypothetical protein